MDLSYRFPDPAAGDALPVADPRLSAMLAGRRAVAVDALLAPAHGAFNAGMVARLARWREE